jgi:hypothetical protein
MDGNQDIEVSYLQYYRSTVVFPAVIYNVIEYMSERNGNVAEVFLDSCNQALGIVFQIAGMRKMIAKFPQIVLVDATYCTNASNYKLFSFMVTDAFGRGQFVQHAFVASESKDVIVKVLNIFKQNNPASSEISVFMIDNDLKEESALQEVFPNAVYYCVTFMYASGLTRTNQHGSWTLQIKRS